MFTGKYMELEKKLKTKYRHLCTMLHEMGPCIVAFSGGVDSATLLEAAFQEKGGEVEAVLVSAELVTSMEKQQAITFLEARNIPYHLLQLNILSNENVRLNPPERCYHCKKMIFSAIKNFAAGKSITHILEGSNADDRDDYRPGERALRELSIISPLQDCGFTKKDIRALAWHFGLPQWDRPATPCLATRIPAETPLSADMLRALETAEESLRELGLSGFRLRLQGDTARLELPPPQMSICIEEKYRHRIINILKTTGARYATLDLEGYRRGNTSHAPEE